MSNYLTTLLGEELVDKAKDTFSGMAASVKDVDTAMGKLYQTTSETQQTYENFLTDANKTATELGLSVSSLIEQTSAWAGMGYGFHDSTKLAEISALYSKMSGMDGGSAIESISALMDTFHLAADDISGMTAALSAFDSAASNTSTMEKLQEYISSMTGAELSLPTDTDSLTYTYDTLKAVSEIWGQLSAAQQGMVLNITGTELYKSGMESLMNGIAGDAADSSMIATLSGIGGSMQANASLLDTYTGKTSQFESAYQSLSKTVTDSPALKAITDLGTKLIEILDTVIDKVGLLPTLMAGIAAKSAFKNVGHNKMLLCHKDITIHSRM